MDRLPDLETLQRLYADNGGRQYGEGVSQMEHALQCAVLAQRDGASPSLVVAALLHDVGHLFEDEAEAQAADCRHEMVGARALGALFGDDVRRPIALHVAAKRWLCLREPGYLESLSPASVASLALQGGPFDAAQAGAFERQPYWREAVALRRYDDLGKQDEPAAAVFADFSDLLRSVRA
jgi:phosphonate degradation associated HDIG domain protein